MCWPSRGATAGASRGTALNCNGVAATPLQFGAVPRQPPRPAPVLGQHTDEILSGILGLPGHEIARLHDEKVVGGPR